MSSSSSSKRIRSLTIPLYPVTVASLGLPLSHDQSSTECGTGELYKVHDSMLVEAVQRAVVTLVPDTDYTRSKPSTRLGTKESMQDSYRDEKLRQHVRSLYSSVGTIEDSDVGCLPPAAATQNSAFLVGGRNSWVDIDFVETPGPPPARGFRHTKPFPAMYPGTFGVPQLNMMYDGSRYYCVTPKTHGTQTRIVCMRFYGHPISVLVTRTWDIYLVRFDMPDEFFEGSVLDAELVQTSRGPTLVVFDALMVCGRPIARLVYLHRLQLAAVWLTAWCREIEDVDGKEGLMPTLDHDTSCAYPVQVCRTKVRPNWPLAVRVKNVYAPEEVARVLVRCCPQLDHAIDGWVKMAADSTFQVGDGRECYKMKLRFENTVDFVGFMDEKKQEFLWMLRHGSRWLVWERQKAKDLEEQRKFHGRVVECRYDAVTRHWVAERVRLDKPHPNRPKTALQTWADICEGMRLAQAFPKNVIPESHRRVLEAWDQRASNMEGSLSARWTQSMNLKLDNLPIRKRYPLTMAEVAAQEDV
jgi:hypothetical protein